MRDDHRAHPRYGSEAEEAAGHRALARSLATWRSRRLRERGHEKERGAAGQRARPRSAYARAGPGEAWPRGCSSSAAAVRSASAPAAAHSGLTGVASCHRAKRARTADRDDAVRNRSRCGARRAGSTEVLSLSSARRDRNAKPFPLWRTSGPLVSVAGCRRGPGIGWRPGRRGNSRRRSSAGRNSRRRSPPWSSRCRGR
jgi:hypothetical protein